MNRPPRPRKHGLVDRSLLVRGYLVLGLTNAFFVMIAYFVTLYRGGWRWGEQLSSSPEIIDNPLHLKATTIVFAGIVILQIGTLFAVRSENQFSLKTSLFSNKLILWGIVFAIAFTSAIVYVPFLQKVFNTTNLDFFDWGMLFIFMVAVFLVEEIRKVAVLKSIGTRKA